MQPEPPTISTAIPEHSQQAPRTPTQHGLQAHHDDGDSLSPRAAPTSELAATTLPRLEQVAADAAFAASLQQELGGAPGDTGRGLKSSAKGSAKGTPSPPSGGNRITEYEKASTPPVKKTRDPGFEVIKKVRSPGDNRSIIQELPNGGLLT